MIKISEHLIPNSDFENNDKHKKLILQIDSVLKTAHIE